MAEVFCDEFVRLTDHITYDRRQSMCVTVYNAFGQNRCTNCGAQCTRISQHRKIAKSPHDLTEYRYKN